MDKSQGHTREIHNIITAPPSWLLRWGGLCLAAILVLIILSAAFITYPENVIISGRYHKTTSFQLIGPGKSGCLFLKARNNSYVDEGQLIATVARSKTDYTVIDSIKAGKAGYLIFLKSLTNRQPVNIHQPLFKINGKEQVYLNLLLPQSSNYAIKTGQQIAVAALTGEGSYAKPKSVTVERLVPGSTKAGQITVVTALQAGPPVQIPADSTFNGRMVVRNSTIFRLLLKGLFSRYNFGQSNSKIH